jgi:outer membrane protein assembly factor BamA
MPITWAQQQVKDSTAHKKEHKIDFTGIPIVSYNGSYGTIVGFNTMFFFNVNKKDTISPASMAGLGGGYSENRSWFAAGFTQLYLKEDRWRITAGAGLGDVNFQYYESANEGSDGEFVDYNSVSRFALFKVMRQIFPHFYGGVVIKLQHSKTVFGTPNDSTVAIDANGFGISALYDTRDNVYYPRKGWKASLSLLSNTEWLGSDDKFNSVRGYANYYWNVSKEAVLASRASMFMCLGDVPFSAQHAVGGKDIRGYTDGKYRGDQVFSAQTEYRWTFYKRWGAVGFFGVAVTEKPSSKLLPGGGVGVRFLAIPKRQINIGVDGAIGSGDAGIYFRIGEAF